MLAVKIIGAYMYFSVFILLKYTSILFWLGIPNDPDHDPATPFTLFKLSAQSRYVPHFNERKT